MGLGVGRHPPAVQDHGDPAAHRRVELHHEETAAAAEVGEKALPIGPLEAEILVARGAPEEARGGGHHVASQLVCAHRGVAPLRDLLQRPLALQPLAALEGVDLEEGRLLDQDDPNGPGYPADQGPVADHRRERLDHDGGRRDPLEEGGAAREDRDGPVGSGGPAGEPLRRRAGLRDGPRGSRSSVLGPPLAAWFSSIADIVVGRPRSDRASRFCTVLSPERTT